MRVSKDGSPLLFVSSFETPAARAPQDEALANDLTPEGALRCRAGASGLSRTGRRFSNHSRFLACAGGN